MISWEYSPSSAQCSLPVVWVSPQASVGHEVVQHALQGVGVLLERQNVLGIGRTTDNVNVLVYTMLLLCSYLMSITRLSLFDVDIAYPDPIENALVRCSFGRYSAKLPVGTQRS